MNKWNLLCGLAAGESAPFARSGDDCVANPY